MPGAWFFEMSSLASSHRFLLSLTARGYPQPTPSSSQVLHILPGACCGPGEGPLRGASIAPVTLTGTIVGSAGEGSRLPHSPGRADGLMGRPVPGLRATWLPCLTPPLLSAAGSGHPSTAMAPPRLFWVWLLVAGTQGELSPWEMPKAKVCEAAAAWVCTELQGDALPGARGPAVSQGFSPPCGTRYPK